MDSLERLAGTRIKTNISTGEAVDRYNFGLVVQYKVHERRVGDHRDQMSSIAIELPSWLYRAVVSGEVLTLDRDYFRLRGGIERRLYELARKHCGAQVRWSIGMENLHKKSGSQSPVKAFRHQVLKLVKSNHLPSYSMAFDDEKDQLTFYSRKGTKAAKAVFDEQIKKQFSADKHPVPKPVQTGLNFG